MDQFKAGNQVGQAAGRGWADYAEWVALGAVVAGSVGAIVGAAKCSHGARASRLPVDRPESALLTAPHGDKLATAREW